MKAMFGNMSSIQPNASVIDNDKTERIVLTRVVEEDIAL